MTGIMMAAAGTHVAGSQVGTVVATDFDTDEVLSGGAVPVVSGVRFNPLGNVDEISGRSGGAQIFTNIHPGEWWSEEPTVGIGADYDIRCEALTSGTWSLEAAAVGTYVNMSAERVWRVDALGGGKSPPNSKQCVADFQIRLAVSPFTVLASFEVDSRAEKTQC